MSNTTQNLFVKRSFTSHSGVDLDWKIDCDALSEEDIETLAFIISRTFSFGRVVGVPTGGLRLAAALEKYATDGGVLIVDDVLTTGKSMEEARDKVSEDVMGAVIFARGDYPDWIFPIFECRVL